MIRTIKKCKDCGLEANIEEELVLNDDSNLVLKAYLYLKGEL